MSERPKRERVPDRLRFEVFKRDGFVCVYCGAKPPGVVLHADHVVAVANGGTNDMDNLVTACATCNQGKGAVPLSVAAAAHVRAEMLAKAQEVAAIDAAYNEWLRVQRAAKRAAVERLSQAWSDEGWRGMFALTEEGKGSIEYFLSRLLEEEVREAMYVAIRRVPFPNFDPKWTTTGRKYAEAMGHVQRRFRYFCGVCHTKIRERGGATE